jgi:hypothetical protein
MRTLTQKAEEAILAPALWPTDRDEGTAGWFFHVLIERLGTLRHRGDISPNAYDWLIETWAASVVFAMIVCDDPFFARQFLFAMSRRHESEELFLVAVSERAMDLYAEWTTANERGDT